MVEAACPAALLSHATNRVFWRGVVSACLLITSEKSFVMAHCLLLPQPAVSALFWSLQMYAPRWERDDGDGPLHVRCSLPLLAELPAHVVAKAVGGSPLSPGRPPDGSTRTERYIHR